VPAHCWLTDWFEHASFGNALLFATPLTGVYVALRLVLPFAPDWALQVVGIASAATAVYAAGMALVQKDVRRFFAYLFLNNVSLVLVGLGLHTSVSLAGALCLWLAVTLSLAGLGLTLRALEARYGRLSLDDFHGLYEHSPMLAVCFLVTGLASVGFPGTLGFVASELLAAGAVEADLAAGVAVVAAAALTGIAVVRVYFLLFTGARHFSSVSLAATARERFVLLTLMALILGGGLFPQPGVARLYAAAEGILQARGPAATDHRDAGGQPAAVPGGSGPPPAARRKVTRQQDRDLGNRSSLPMRPGPYPSSKSSLKASASSRSTEARTTAGAERATSTASLKPKPVSARRATSTRIIISGTTASKTTSQRMPTASRQSLSIPRASSASRGQRSSAARRCRHRDAISTTRRRYAARGSLRSSSQSA
jgi:hypothetical protein